MSDDRSIIYLRVAPERIADVNWIMEGYEQPKTRVKAWLNFWARPIPTTT